MGAFLCRAREQFGEAWHLLHSVPLCLYSKKRLAWRPLHDALLQRCFCSSVLLETLLWKCRPVLEFWHTWLECKPVLLHSTGTTFLHHPRRHYTSARSATDGTGPVSGNEKPGKQRGSKRGRRRCSKKRKRVNPAMQCT